MRIQRTNAVLNLDVSTRKHHIIRLGDLELSNGYGIRWDCYTCAGGFTATGAQCPTCGELPK